MDPRLANLIASYQETVAECVQLLVDSGASLPAKDYEWPPAGFPQIGTLLDGREYFCHGVGCAVRLRKGQTVDFDFGENGEIDGFSRSRLLAYVGDKPEKFDFESRDEIVDVFEDSKSEFVFSGCILYHLPDDD